MLSVGALDFDTEGNPIKASFSNYNSPGVNEFVDLAAPGVGLFTTIPSGLYDGTRSNGTSFATPLVSGVVALLRTQYPDQSVRAISSHLERALNSSLLVGNELGKGVLDGDAVLSTSTCPNSFSC